jgi:hypothetical protein
MQTPLEVVMKVDREQVTAAITTAQSAARSEEIAATAETLRWARCAGPDAVRYLHYLVCDDRTAPSYRTRAAVAILDVGGFLGVSSAELKSSVAFRELAAGVGASSRDVA